MPASELSRRMTFYEFQMWKAIAHMDYQERTPNPTSEPDIIDQLDQIAYRRQRR